MTTTPIIMTITIILFLIIILHYKPSIWNFIKYVNSHPNWTRWK